MVVHASRFPECRIEDRQSKRYEREKENKQKLIEIENERHEEVIVIIANKLAENMNIWKYVERVEKERKIHKRNLEYLLSLNS